MAIKNKIKEKKEKWKEWHIEQPEKKSNIKIGDIGISVDFEKETVQITKGSSVIEFKTDYLDDIIDFIAEGK